MKHVNELDWDDLFERVFNELDIYHRKHNSTGRYIKHRQSEGAKNATINRELAALRRMFRLAAQDDRIPKIPHFPMLEEDNVRSGFLEHSEYQKLLAELPAYLRPILITAYWTGCRKSEILSLKWSQVDFLSRQIILDARNTRTTNPGLFQSPVSCIERC